MSAEYWRDHAARGPMLRPLGRPCHDCAVTWGLYRDLSDDLARQPSDVREAVSANWFCHNHPDRACAGNIENLAARARTHKEN